jgi:hypothetical protein
MFAGQTELLLRWRRSADEMDLMGWAAAIRLMGKLDPEKKYLHEEDRFWDLHRTDPYRLVSARPVR